jgi:hypothetical protein
MGPASRRLPVVSVITAHGRQELEWRDGERLFDLLNRYDVPWSAVSIYVVPRSGGEAAIQPCLDRVLSGFSEAGEILLYFNRNVNPFIFALRQFKTIPSSGPGREAVEYIYQKLDNVSSSTEVYLKKLSPEECREIISERVAEMVRATIPKGAHIVIGVSGGGDSNALLHGFSQLRDHPVTLHPLIIKGIPDWDKGVPRARALCESYGLPLSIIEEPQVNELLGFADSRLGLIDRFEREFEGDDFEFLGTLLIRLALSARAREIGTPFICTGLNLEDLLSENLFRVSSGLAHRRSGAADRRLHAGISAVALSKAYPGRLLPEILIGELRGALSLLFAGPQPLLQPGLRDPIAISRLRRAAGARIFGAEPRQSGDLYVRRATWFPRRTVRSISPAAAIPAHALADQSGLRKPQGTRPGARF